MIKQVKNQRRANLAALPYALPRNLLDWLVEYCVGRVNLIPPDTSSVCISPAELYRGHRAKHKTGLALSFGKYCEVYEADEVTDMTKACMVDAIALCPVGNMHGTWWFMQLNTMRAAKRR